MPHILVVGSLAYDDVQTPFERRRDVLGGAASYFSLAARLYAPVRLVGVIGDDFRDDDVERFRTAGIDISGIERRSGRSFRWLGRYDYDFATAETINTDLGVFGDWRPRVPEAFADSEFVFLANIDPEIQLEVLSQVREPVAVALDTMNYWIENRRSALDEVLRKVDVVSVNEAEVRQLADTHNVLKAAREILARGPRAVIVKRAEHGAQLFMEDRSFWAPAYPLEDVRDPTGAGDAFAGGFIGHLARTGKADDATLGTQPFLFFAKTSYAVETFSVDGMERATLPGVDGRIRVLEALVAP